MAAEEGSTTAWDVDFPTEEEAAQFFEALGLAVSLWAGVEEALYQVFEHAVMPGQVGCAMNAFHALQHTQSKINVAHAAMHTFLLLHSPGKLDDWKKLKSRCEDMLRRRNELAHFQVFTHTRRKSRKDKIVLRTPMLDARHIVGLKKIAEHPRATIQHLAERFDALRSDLRLFLATVPHPVKKAPAQP